jgi:ParB-like chromosome segregation protein Spo0J
MQLRIEYLATDLLRPYDGNARTHSEAQVAQIIASIREFGFTNPILANDQNVVIAGHGRLLAAQHMGLASVPVVRLGHLSERQVRALTLADNKIALNAGWDFAKLSDELSAIAEMDFDLGLTGFDEQELDALLKSDADVLPATWATPNVVSSQPHEGPAVVAPDAAAGPDPRPASVSVTFKGYDDQTIPTDYCCPSCGYKWGGPPK